MFNLSPNITWTLVASLTLLALAVFFFHTYVCYRRLSHIPGPWLAQISPFWLFHHTFQSQVIRAVEELHQRYGRIVRISGDQIATDDPDLFKAIASTGSPFTRGYWFDGARFDPRQDNLFSTRNTAAHAALKSKLLPGYHGKDGLDFEKHIDSRLKELMHAIRYHYVNKNEAFDFVHLSGYFTLDVLTSIAFSKNIGYLERNQDVYDYFKLTQPFLKFFELGANHPSFLRLISVIRRFVDPMQDNRFGLGAIIGETHRAVAARFDADCEDLDASDMLSSFMRRGLSQVDCEVEAMAQIIGGSDSTAQAIRTCLICVMSNPVASAKLHNEIQQAVSAGNISYPVIKNDEALKLPYLQACIQEGIRWFMPINPLGGREVPVGGYTWNGIFMPEKTQVTISYYAMLRRKDIFGADADTFRPERWLDQTNPKVLERMKSVQSMAFGYGPTSCIGKKIALLELNKTVFELFRTFDFCRVDPLSSVKTFINGPVTQEGMVLRAFEKSTG